jgi:hypothetical protein
MLSADPGDGPMVEKMEQLQEMLKVTNLSHRMYLLISLESHPPHVIVNLLFTITN